MSGPTGTGSLAGEVRWPFVVEGDGLRSFEGLSGLEWLETNGLGGWASSTVSGAHTRRYHGLLVVATRPPLGRVVLFSKLDETLHVGRASFELGTNRFHETVHPQGYQFLQRFERGCFPRFEYRAGSARIGKTIAAVHGVNTTLIGYELFEAPEACTLELRPLIAGRDYHALRRAGADPPEYSFAGDVLRMGPFESGTHLFLGIPGSEFEARPDWWYGFEYVRDRERGFDDREDLWTPGLLRVRLRPGESVCAIASTEPPGERDGLVLLRTERERRMTLLDRLPVRDAVTTPLALAADQFIVRRGSDRRSVIAGYHWFGDWGRDTLIALPGLTLATGRYDDARLILRALADFLDRGLVPNRFPDQEGPPEYNSADATLWYFVALRQYVRATDDWDFVRELLPALREMLRWHREGTRYGIRVDRDGLLAAGEPGVQLTWMDAKVGDRVVTPRMGKPVEVNALWYNALRILAHFEGRAGDGSLSDRLDREAAGVHQAFEDAFWYEQGGYLFDVVAMEGKDASLRPNQILALALPFDLLSMERRRSVLRVVEASLLTPVGLRSLAPSDPAYRSRYEGDANSRDSAYHQGTVWAWLLGPYITALVRLRGDEGRQQARVLIERAMGHLAEAGVGTFSEIFDAEPDHAPRGAIAQAWSVAELLRSYIEEVLG